jgi:hypothetical protein
MKYKSHKIKNEDGNSCEHSCIDCKYGDCGQMQEPCLLCLDSENKEDCYFETIESEG